MPTTEGGMNTKLNLTHAIDGFAGNEHAIPALPLYKDVVQLFGQSEIGYTPTLVVSPHPYAIQYFYNTRDPLNDPKLNRFTPPQFLEDRLRRWDVGAHESEYDFPLVAQSVAKIFRAGGNIGAGDHGNLQGIGYHWELELLASGGLTPPEVLRIATIGSAEIIGRHTELGSLEPGKYADLIVFDKNPLTNIRHTESIEYVMKNGRLYNDENLKQVWPVQ